MVRMGAIWDRTQDVLRGRGGMLAGIALLTLVVPDWLRAAWVAAVPAGLATATGVLMIGLLGAVLTLVGQLAIIAAASDPAIGRDEAFMLGFRRFLPALGIAVLLGLVVLIVMLPVLSLLSSAGLNISAEKVSAWSMTDIDPARALSALPYIVVLLPVLLFVLMIVGARFALIWPVVLFERNGWRAPLRAWRLTRGLTARLVGVLILWAIVLAVAVAALVGAGGVVFALVFGPGTTALAVAMALISAIVTVAAAVIQSAFAAQLYVAIAGSPVARDAEPA